MPLPKAWLVADLERTYAELAADVERLRWRLAETKATVDAQGRRLEALRKRIAEQARHRRAGPRGQ